MMLRLFGVILAAAQIAGAAAEAAGAERRTGETLYVPVYSHIWHGNLDGSSKPARILLSSMLSIRNTDLEHAITIRSVRYYDNDGKLLREYPAAQRMLGPLGSADVFVENKDAAGGTGANFIVVWDAALPVNTPVVETVNAYFFGAQSAIFTSPAKSVLAAGD